jgi:hypothetical protein
VRAVSAHGSRSRRRCAPAAGERVRVRWIPGACRPSTKWEVLVESGAQVTYRA